MDRFRSILKVLAIGQVVLAGFTGIVGAFANEGEFWLSLVVIGVHPVCAGILLVFLFLPRPTLVLAYVVAALLAVNIFVDLTVALLIAFGKGDWALPLVFVVVPAVGLAYALTVARRIDGNREN